MCALHGMQNVVIFILDSLLNSIFTSLIFQFTNIYILAYSENCIFSASSSSKLIKKMEDLNYYFFE